MQTHCPCDKSVNSCTQPLNLLQHSENIQDRRGSSCFPLSCARGTKGTSPSFRTLTFPGLRTIMCLLTLGPSTFSGKRHACVAAVWKMYTGLDYNFGYTCKWWLIASLTFGSKCKWYYIQVLLRDERFRHPVIVIISQSQKEFVPCARSEVWGKSPVLPHPNPMGQGGWEKT